MLIKTLSSIILCMILISLQQPAVKGQTAANVTLALAEERRLGTDCPGASALSPAGDRLWVLMHNCGYEDYYLLNFALAGSRFEFNTNEGEDFASALTGLEGVYFDGLLNSPLSVRADGSPQLQFFNSDGAMQTLRPAQGAAEVNSSLTERIVNISSYPELAVFNADQSAVAVTGADGIYIFDAQTGAEVLAITVDASVLDWVKTQFSADGQSIDLIIPNNTEDINATAATLYRYSLPDGELQMEQSLLTSLAWISPNGQYILLWMGDDELIVTEPATGGVSDSVHMFDEPRRMTTCVNEGGPDPTDLNVIWDGFLPPMGINWLSDSSGFVTVNSYMGAGSASDGGSCLFEESRLRRYTVGHEE